MSADRETYSTEGPQCPCCKRQYTADEAAYYRDDYTEETCDQCGETFDVEVYHSTSWTCTERDKQEQDVSATTPAAGEGGND